jgi:hypothetical protein
MDTGISPQLKAYISGAIAEVKFEVFAKYLPPEAMHQMRRHYQGRVREWPARMSAIRQQMAADPARHSNKARERGQRARNRVTVPPSARSRADFADGPGHDRRNDRVPGPRPRSCLSALVQKAGQALALPNLRPRFLIK